MKHEVSVWTLKKRPLQEVLHYIEQNSSPAFQAKMVNLRPEEYSNLNHEAAREKLEIAISQMDDELYTDYLLEIIDE